MKSGGPSRQSTEIESRTIVVSAFGKFELLTCLAKGGMAEVFLARQKSEGRFERLLVIKRILPQYADDPRFIELFLEEARIAALLDHPNVIPVYDFGKVDDTYFLAMPFVRGLSVQTLLRNMGPLPLDVTCEILRQTLVGLDYVHNLESLDGEPLGLVHRDISPANLMVNAQGRVLLLDFGIASVADSATFDTGSLRGKLAYMSPEQIEVEELDQRSDLFSLGAVACELFTGERLFRRRNDPEVIRAITAEPIPDPASLDADIPAMLAAVLEKSLKQQRDERYATAAQMRDDLEEAIDELEIVASSKTLVSYLDEHCAELLDAQGREASDARQGLLPGDAATAVEVPHPNPTTARSKPRQFPWTVISLIAVLAIIALGGLIYELRSQPEENPSGPPLTMALTPYLPEAEMREVFQPLLNHLGRVVNRPIQVRVALNYDDAVNLLIEEPDIQLAELTAYPYLLAKRRDSNIHVLATPISQKVKTYESYFVVRRDDPAQELADVQGRRVCFIDHTSTSGYLMPRAMLRKAGYDPDHFFESIQFSGNHYRALRDLLADRCDVATVTSPAFLTAGQRNISVSKVRIIAVSSSLPNGVFCASSDLSADLVDSLRQALLDFDVRAMLGQEALSKMVPLTGFARVPDDAFDALAHEVELLHQRGSTHPVKTDGGPRLDASSLDAGSGNDDDGGGGNS